MVAPDVRGIVLEGVGIRAAALETEGFDGIGELEVRQHAHAARQTCRREGLVRVEWNRAENKAEAS